MCADKLADQDGAQLSITKIHRAPNGDLIGTAGDSHHGRLLRDWYCSGADPAEAVDTDAQMLVATVDGRLLHYSGNKTGRPVEIEGSRWAIGSGAPYAITVMHLGMSAYDAVEIACHLASGCGGGIDKLELVPDKQTLWDEAAAQRITQPNRKSTPRTYGWVCSKCGTDRTKASCPRHLSCPMVGVAQ